MPFDISSLFSLGGIVLASGKTEQTIGSILVLEPLIADSMANGSFDAGKFLDTVESLTSAGQITTQTKAAANLVTTFGEILADPKQGPHFLTAIRSLLGVQKGVKKLSPEEVASNRNGADSALKANDERLDRALSEIDQTHATHDDQAGATIPHPPGN